MDGDSLNAICTTTGPTGVTLSYDYLKGGTVLTGGRGLISSTFTLPSTVIGTADGDYTCSVTANGETFTSDVKALARKLVRSLSFTLHSSAHSSATRLSRDHETNKYTSDEPPDEENKLSDGI